MKNVFIILCFVFSVIVSCKKEAEPNCVTWIVSDSWENAKGQQLQDYNRIYGYQSGHQVAICGAAKDTIYLEKKVILRKLHDTAFYVRVFAAKYIPNDD